MAAPSSAYDDAVIFDERQNRYCPPGISLGRNMPTLDVDGIRLNFIAWGSGNETLVFIHGNLACADWFSLVAPLLPARFRVVAIDWRGCGGSDKPSPKPDCSNYTIRQHAQDMLAVLGRLGIDRCHLATHSTGGIISTCMLLAEPERFQKVLALDPVGPMGLKFPPESIALLKTMRSSRENTRSGLALTASTLFRPESLGGAAQPVFAAHATDQQKDLFERLVDNTFGVSDGIWFGTPASLNAEWGSGDLRQRQEEIRHEHLVLWGALDPFIPRQDMEEMATRMPNCRLIVVPEVGHSLLIERPELCAKHIAHFF
jgi:non-heme chloroperoxidase